MALRASKTAVKTRRSTRRAAMLLGALAAGGCSHAWDALDPSLSSAGAGGDASAGVSDSAVASGAGVGSTSGAGGDAASSSASTSAVASSSASGAGGSMNPSTVEYVATVAECAGFNTTTMALVDPTACGMQAGNAQLVIDSDSSSIPAFLSGYLRFDLDGALAGKTIDAVKLRLVVTTSSSANSTHSGEVWQDSPFTEADLAMALPMKVGMAPISPDLGAVMQNQTVDWPLPASVVAPNAPVFLELFPVSGDGTNYWKNNGPLPPKLIIDYH